MTEDVVALAEQVRQEALAALAARSPEVFVVVDGLLHIRSDAPADATCPCCDKPLATSPLPRWPTNDA
jgi:hypothetical protein